MRSVFKSTEDFQEVNKTVGLPYTENVSVLGKPLTVKGKTINNRLVCQAMEGCDGEANGLPGELTKRRYMRFAKGGAGLIWFEATAVVKEGRANPRQLYIDRDNLDGFRRIVEEIKETGLKTNGYEPKIIMQATHSGRYSKPNGYPEPIIAYNNPIFEGDKPIDKSRIVTDEELDRIQEKLIGAAKLASDAGFDGVDIKSCHRYLLSELLSGYTREGKYGKTYENRTRMLKGAVAGAVANTPDDFIVSSRLNVYDGFQYPYGFGVKEGEGITPDFTEAKKLIAELYGLGVRILNITMGNPYFNPHVNRPYANGGYIPPEEPISGVVRMLEGTAELQRSLPELPLICSALSYLGVAAPNVAASYIENGGFAFAGFGRQIFAYPDFANDIIKNGCLTPSKCCIACSKCTELMRAGGTPGCIIKDSELYMPLYKKYVMEKKQ